MTRLAVAQLTSTTSQPANLSAVRELAALAAASDATMLALPECFDYIGAKGTSLRIAEPLSGPRLATYRALAAETGIWLSLGGFHELGPDAHRVYNTHVVLDASGAIRAAYRKIHLFDACLPTAPMRESDSTAPGDELVVVHGTPVGDVGVSTCYDVRFPGMYAALRAKGAEVILVPAAFHPVTGAAHWHTLVRARAIETQCYVAAAAQVGTHDCGRVSYGHALAVGPWGEVLNDAGPREAPKIYTMDVDLARLKDVRARMPVVEHARPDIYRY